MTVSEILKAFTPDCGVCAFAPLVPHLLSCRAAARLPENPQSVVMLIFPYRFPENGTRELSRYACVPDYHRAAGAVLEAAAAACEAAFPAHRFVPFLDNSPIPEVRAAALAGLGVIGQNGLLLHPVYGSYIFLGELVTDMVLTPADAAFTPCPGCGACSSACPGGCLPGTGRDTCVSAISQKKGTLSDAETALLRKGGLIWGCDRCQEVCPLNAHAKIAPHPCFDSYCPRFLPDDPAFDTRAYAWRGKTVPLRNAALLDKKG